MKWLISILLLLVTACYVLPVKEFIHGGHAVCMADMDDEKVEHEKKEKSKELFSFYCPGLFVLHKSPAEPSHIPLYIPLSFHTVETPPPDVKG